MYKGPVLYIIKKNILHKRYLLFFLSSPLRIAQENKKHERKWRLIFKKYILKYLPSNRVLIKSCVKNHLGFLLIMIKPRFGLQSLSYFHSRILRDKIPVYSNQWFRDASSRKDHINLFSFFYKIYNLYFIYKNKMHL